MAGIRFDDQGTSAQSSRVRFDEPAPNPPGSRIRFDESPQNYEDVLRSAKGEIDRLNEQQIAAGRAPLSASAQTALTDQYRQKSGFAPIAKQMDELNIVDYGSARNLQAKQSKWQDYRQASARGIASLGPNIVDLVDTDRGGRMRANVEATYGTESAGIAGFLGDITGATLSVIGALPAGPLGMAGIYSASGAGATRGDIAARRAAGEDISVEDEIVASTLIGGAEGLSGLITGGILNKAKGLVIGTGVGKIGAKTARTGILNLIKKEAPDLVKEVGEEMATQLVTNAVRKNTYAEDQELMQGVVESGLMSIVPVLGAKGVAKRLQAKPRRSALTAQERQPTMIDSRKEYLKDEDQARALQEEGEKLGVLKPEEYAPAIGTDERSLIEAEADAKVQAQVEALEASGDIPPAVVPAKPSDPTVQFPSRLETPADVEGFFGTMEKDANVLASYTDEPMVLVDIPVADIPNQQLGLPGEVSPAKLDTIRAGDPASQPPIMAVGVGKDNLFIPDGNHRVIVARERGDASIKGYVPESLASERGYTAGVSIEQDAIDAGVLRPTEPEPTQEQRVQQEAQADAAIEQQLRAVEQQDADTAAVEQLATDLERKVKVIQKPKPTDSAQDVLESAQMQRGAKPATRVGRMVKAVKRGLVSRTADPETGALERRIIGSKQRQQLSRDDTMRFIGLTKDQAKAEGIDLSDPLIRKGINDAIEGKAAPRHIKEFVKKTREAIDAKSEEMAVRLEALGLKDRAKLIRENKGKYLQEFANPESWGKATAKRLFGPPEVKFTKSFGKMKRDAPILSIDGKWKKFKTEAERDAAYDAAVEDRGSDRGVKRIAPITDVEREEKFIRSPLYRAGMTMMNMEHDIETMAVLQDVAKAYGHKRPKSVKARDAAEWARVNDLVPLPEAGRLHALMDVYVPRRIGKRLRERYEMPSHIRHIYNSYLRIWKDSKTTKNPATHARNMLSNAMFFSTYAGVNPADPRNWSAYAKAAKMLKEGTTNADYRKLVEQGVIGSEFTSVELNDELQQSGFGEDPTSAIIRLALKTHRTTQKVYQAEDVIFKLAKFSKEMAEHGDADRAAAEVDYYFPNYNEISKLASLAKKTPVFGVPFAAFMDQSIRITARTAVREPQRLAMAMAVPFVIDQISRVYLGVEDEEDELMGRTGWGYFTKTFISPLVYNPFAGEGRDKQGAAVALNMGSVVPLLNDITPKVNNGQLQVPWFATDPLGNLFREQMGSRDSFTGRKFTDEDNTIRQNALARLGQGWDAVAPLPPIFGSGRKRIMKAVEGQGEETLGVSLMATLAGINVQRDYIPEDEAKKVWYQLIEDGSIETMINAVDSYNENYRQGKAVRVDLDRVFSGYTSTLRASRSTAIKHAAAELFAGNEKKAQSLIDEYNKNMSKSGVPATLNDAKAKVESERSKGRRY